VTLFQCLTTLVTGSMEKISQSVATFFQRLSTLVT